jgi:hypothetical protein
MPLRWWMPQRTISRVRRNRFPLALIIRATSSLPRIRHIAAVGGSFRLKRTKCHRKNGRYVIRCRDSLAVLSISAATKRHPNQRHMPVSGLAPSAIYVSSTAVSQVSRLRFGVSGSGNIPSVPRFLSPGFPGCQVSKSAAADSPPMKGWELADEQRMTALTGSRCAALESIGEVFDVL